MGFLDDIQDVFTQDVFAHTAMTDPEPPSPPVVTDPPAVIGPDDLMEYGGMAAPTPTVTGFAAVLGEVVQAKIEVPDVIASIQVAPPRPPEDDDDFFGSIGKAVDWGMSQVDTYVFDPTEKLTGGVIAPDYTAGTLSVEAGIPDVLSTGASIGTGGVAAHTTGPLGGLAVSVDGNGIGVDAHAGIDFGPLPYVDGHVEVGTDGNVSVGGEVQVTIPTPIGAVEVQGSAEAEAGVDGVSVAAAAAAHADTALGEADVDAGAGAAVGPDGVDVDVDADVDVSDDVDVVGAVPDLGEVLQIPDPPTLDDLPDAPTSLDDLVTIPDAPTLDDLPDAPTSLDDLISIPEPPTSLDDLADLTLPTFESPAMADLQLPEFQAPDLQLPGVDLPDVAVPSVDAGRVADVAVPAATSFAEHLLDGVTPTVETAPVLEVALPYIAEQAVDLATNSLAADPITGDAGAPPIDAPAAPPPDSSFGSAGVSPVGFESAAAAPSMGGFEAGGATPSMGGFEAGGATPPPVSFDQGQTQQISDLAASGDLSSAFTPMDDAAPVFEVPDVVQAVQSGGLDDFTADIVSAEVNEAAADDLWDDLPG